MAIDSVTNFARSTVTSGAMTAGSPANGGTFTVADGSTFPTSNFYVVIDVEIILISSRSGNTFTVHATTGRGQRGTTAASHSNGAQVFNGPLAHHVSESAYLTQDNAFTATGTTTFAGDVQGRRLFAGGTVLPEILSGVGGTHPGSDATLYGHFVNVRFPTTTTTQATAARFQAETTAATWTAALVEGIRVAGPIIGANSSITDLHGIRVISQGLVAATVTNGYGITVDRAKTAALWLGADADGLTATGGILFGLSQDTNLYRSAANVLKTDDTFIATSVQALTASFARLSDATVVTIKGHSTQTNNILQVENAASTRTYLAVLGDITTNQSGVVVNSYSTATTAGFTIGIKNVLDVVSTSAVGTVHLAGHSWTQVANSITQNFTADTVGHIGQVGFGSTGTHSGLMVGIKGSIDNSNASHGLISTEYGVLSAVDDAATATTAVLFKGLTPQRAGGTTNFYGMWIDPISKGSTLSVGARIDTPTGAGTKVGLWLGANTADPTTLASGIAIGSARDVTLMRTNPFFVELETNTIFSANLGAVKIGAVGPSLASGIQMGNDTVLYRDTTNSMTTTAAFNAATVKDNGTLVTKQIAFTFTRAGTLTTATGTSRQYIDGGNWTIVSIRASVNTAPTGASIIVDVNKNGTTVHTTQSNRATIAVSTFTDLADSIQVASLTTGDYLTVDIDQVGSTIAGADLTVTIWLQRAA